MKKPLNLKTALLLREVYNQRQLDRSFFNEPNKITSKLNIELDPEVEEAIHQIGKSGLIKNLEPVDHSIVKKFNEVVKDGRYLKEFFLEPEKVSEKLEIKLTQEEIKRIKDYQIEDLAELTPIPPPGDPNEPNIPQWPGPRPIDPHNPFPNIPNNPHPIPDPISPHAGTAEYIIVVAIGIILLANTDQGEPPILDFSGIKKL